MHLPLPILNFYSHSFTGFPGVSDSKVSAYNARDLGSIPGSGRSSGEGNGNPLQYSCLENPMDGGACDFTFFLSFLEFNRKGVISYVLFHLLYFGPLKYY